MGLNQTMCAMREGFSCSSGKSLRSNTAKLLIDSHGLHAEYYNPEKNRLEPPNWKHSCFETSLSQVPKMYKEPEIFRNQLA